MCCSAGDATSALSKSIDRNLKDEDARNKSGRFTLLLLGTGESGKTTIAKQMKILHLDGYTDPERRAFRDVVYGNIVSCIKTIAIAADKFGYKCEDENLADSIRNLNSSTLTPELWAAIGQLWKDEAIGKAWARSSEYQLIDSAQYWFDHLERISKEADYVPTVDDILHARQMTTGIVEILWEFEKKTFKLIDVGGQRNHRAKWIHAFEGITAVMFCIALSEYDQKLREDEAKRRMEESMELFAQVVNSEWFYKTPIVIFFNKKDLFAKKILTKPLSVCFPDYPGAAQSYDEAFDFIKERFQGLDERKFPARKIYDYQTCATDTGNVKRVFETVRDVLINKSIQGVFGS